MKVWKGKGQKIKVSTVCPLHTQTAKQETAMKWLGPVATWWWYGVHCASILANQKLDNGVIDQSEGSIMEADSADK